MKKLTKQQRHEIYKKAHELAYKNLFNDGRPTINKGVCILLQHSDYAVLKTEKYYYWEIKNENRFPEFLYFFNSGEYEYNNTYREIVILLCIEMTKPNNRKRAKQ